MFVSTSACNSKRDVYIVFVDSVIEIEACTFLKHRKGNFLYSTAIAQSTMDYLPKAIEDGVVDSPPNCGVTVAMNSPSPL